MANVGDMRNTGIELSLNADAIRTKDFDWNISLNLAHNENEVTRLSNDVFTMDKILLGDVFIRGGSSSGTHVLEEGRPIGQFYGLVCNGIDENGRYIMVDKDGDARFPIRRIMTIHRIRSTETDIWYHQYFPLQEF